MLDRTCAVCSGTMAGRRSDATMCSAACRTWGRRHPGVRRPTGPQAYICKCCSETFTRPGLVPGKQPRFCGDVCWEAWRHRQRPFGEWRKAEPFKPRPFVCSDCGAAGEDSGYGPQATRCEPCRKAYEIRKAREWAQANPERRRGIALDWVRRNPEAVRHYYGQNREAILRQMQGYRAENRDRVLAWSRDGQARRRARQAAVTVEIFTSEEIYVRDQWVCGICTTTVDPARRWPDPVSPSLDHIIPLSRGGAHARWNVQLAHLSCNVLKGASLP